MPTRGDATNLDSIAEFPAGGQLRPRLEQDTAATVVIGIDVTAEQLQPRGQLKLHTNVAVVAGARIRDPDLVSRLGPQFDRVGRIGDLEGQFGQRVDRDGLLMAVLGPQICDGLQPDRLGADLDRQ